MKTRGQMRKPNKTIKALGIALSSWLLVSSSLNAQGHQENMPIVVELMNRVKALEEDNRNLRGQLEEAQHTLTQLNQKVEVLNSDIDYRFSHQQGGEMPPPKNLVNHGNAPATHPPQHGVSGNATEAYERARSFLEQGDYDAAEQAFAAFVASHPKDPEAGAAQYWLGVTYFVRGQHDKAAASFAKGYKNYPKSSKAADNLLKLAKSLAALDRVADACTTLNQLSSEHPKAHAQEVAKEKKSLNCKS